MITLRPYQLDAIEAIKKGFETSDRQYIEMPTGAGKTVTFLSFAKLASNYILIVVPSRELLNQVYETCLLFWDSYQISRKGNGYDEELSNVHICIINSLSPKYLNNISTGEFGIVIIDEAHHIQSKSYQRVIDTFSHSQIVPPLFLGVTATPDRADGKLMDELLGKKTFKIEIDKLIEQGFLSDVEGYAVKTNIDISDIDSHNGDFSLLQMYDKLSTETRNNLILDICKNQMADRRTIVFCINVKHSIEIANLLSAKGIPSRAIYGDMNEKERHSILKAFRTSQISCLCNCQLLTEGFDEPSIDGIVLARPTRSRSLFIQMIGRGLRIFPGKGSCKIVDIVDNHRHLAGFSCLLDSESYQRVSSFKGIKDIKDQIDQKLIDSIQTHIKRVNFFDNNQLLDELLPTDSMMEYLEEYKENCKVNISFDQMNFSFDEASFLVWFNELKKRYYNGND